MSNALAKNCGAALLIPTTALGFPSDAASRAEARMGSSRQPLKRQKIVREVSLHDPAQVTHLGPIYELARRATASMFGQYKVVVAIWPDRVTAVVAFNPKQAHPRARQLVRAYHCAGAGALLSMEPNSTEEGDLPC